MGRNESNQTDRQSELINQKKNTIFYLSTHLNGPSWQLQKVQYFCYRMRIFSEISMFQDWGKSTLKNNQLVIDQFHI